LAILLTSSQDLTAAEFLLCECLKSTACVACAGCN